TSDGLRQTSQGVDQAVLLALRTSPDPPLSDVVDLLDRHRTALGDSFQEKLINSRHLLTDSALRRLVPRHKWAQHQRTSMIHFLLIGGEGIRSDSPFAQCLPK